MKRRYFAIILITSMLAGSFLINVKPAEARGGSYCYNKCKCKPFFLLCMLACELTPPPPEPPTPPDDPTPDPPTPPDEPTPDPPDTPEPTPKQSLGNNNHWMVYIPRIVGTNFNVLINDNTIQVNWLTNKMMTGEVIVTDEKGATTTFNNINEPLATYHTIIFDLEAGKYTLTPHSIYKTKDIYGRSIEITID